MSKVVVLSGDRATPQRVGITMSDALTPLEAIDMCEAGVRYFREQLFEAEVQRRLAEKEKEVVVEDGE